MKRRGIISDMQAFARMKRHVKNIVEQDLEWWTHRIGKPLYSDDAICIHGQRQSSLGGWLVMAPVNEKVPELLRASGIQFTEKRIWCFGSSVMRGAPNNSISHILIPLDQEACPQPRKKKVMA